ncbi:P-loop containing nucleoside triphosphate hydrolase protein [Hyaloscypha bicolor E]|uniref:P-loop containing nucleoside triphosphate hydrolase protein n=1 Tax=Hyaloscypha bicolor E TaxID=1095630 RepID=A0A2J6T5U0_9HELO|nr:P-loop containing nucleoside triphosphate hydrolase protein [Hyaloscypha bicolor E]PMD58384.1 P-loop containing nucleoside triphosphate hydrolase protein [Hyaloscypha bicolor E]
MEPIYRSLTERALSLKDRLDNGSPGQHRIVVVLAGPPGSGKSTIAAKVVQRLNATSTTPFAALIPMDGFHLPRSALDLLPNRAEAYARRGASWTFDSNGILDLVHSLSESRFEPSSETILAPSFDHALKDPVEDGIRIAPDIGFVLLEGNYLLLDEEPWCRIEGLVDDSWFVDVEERLARGRIAKRHVKSGIETSLEAAVRRAEGNDLVNGRIIRQKLVRPAVAVQSVEE